jgi:S-DNA-T family DNA segregation ATPase FtsK/SpoIIIE
VRQSAQLAPLIVLIDEFADLADQLMLEKSLQRAFYATIRGIAQKGRNKGMHLILCTQRPSADLVPTGIRNLLNGRVALRMNDAQSSRMILDEPGAEHLQRRGDLLFKYDHLLRLQGYYLSLAELGAIVKRVTG